MTYSFNFVKFMPSTMIIVHERQNEQKIKKKYIKTILSYNTVAIKELNSCRRKMQCSYLNGNFNPKTRNNTKITRSEENN